MKQINNNHGRLAAVK